MKPFFPYQGGKSKEYKIIKDYMPRHDILVDVFGGSGSVMLASLKEGEQYHYNDINPTVCGVYRKIQSNDEKFINELDNITINNENVGLINNGALNISDEAAFLFKTKTKFKSILTSSISDLRGREGKKLGELFNAREYMREFNKYDIFISNMHYAEVFEMYRNISSAFLYLDPPYVSKKNNEYGVSFTTNDINNIFRYMEEASCKVMLNIDYVGYTREKFNKFFKVGYPHKYDSANRKNINETYANYHMIAANY